MAIRRTSGEFMGEHQDGVEESVELVGPFEIESDPETGVVRTRAGTIGREHRGKRLAIAAHFLQGEIADGLRARQYAAQPPRSVPKPAKGRQSGVRIPAGYRVCPECSTGAKDSWDCSVCDGAGLVRE